MLMKQIMLDTNIFDKLITDEYFPEVWQAAAGSIQLVTCKIQEQEIASIKDQKKRQLIASIPRQVVPPITLPASSGKHRADQIIAHTAASCCDLFVTEDRKLQEWFTQQYPEHRCINYQQFVALVLQST